MTVPNILQNLGPDFDASTLQRAIDQGAFKDHPDLEQKAREVVQAQALKRSTSANLAPVDEVAVVPNSESSSAAIGDLKEIAKNVVGMATVLASPEVAMQAGLNNAMGANTGSVMQRTGEVMQQFGHDLTAGIIHAPKLTDEHAQKIFDLTVKPATFIGAQIGQGAAMVRMIGLVSKMPVAATIVMKIPERIREIGEGVAIGAGLGAADPNAPDHATAALHGAIAGALIGPALMGISKGFELQGTLSLAKAIGPEDLPKLRDAITMSGIELPADASKFKVAQTIIQNLSKTRQNGAMAKMTGDLLTRQKYIANEIYGGTDLSTDEQRILGGIFRNNPSGISVVTGVSQGTIADEVAAKLGIRMSSVAVPRGVNAEGMTQYDVMIGRPKDIYENFAATDKTTQRITKELNRAARNLDKNVQAPKTNESLLLADGTAVRGGIKPDVLATHLKLQVPSVAGVEDPAFALRSRGRYAKMTVEGTREQPSLKIELPIKPTQEQFDAIGRSADAMRFERVTLVSNTGEEVVLKSPVGAQVQDAMVDMVEPLRIESPFDSKIVSQFARTGVYTGQAAVLADGTPVSMLNKAGKFYDVMDPMLGKKVRVHPSRITLLPTSLTNEFQPSNLFADALNEDEAKAIVKLRMALSAGLGNPITKMEDLRNFANSRGFFADRLKGGAVKLTGAMDQESLEFKDISAAVEHLRASSGPMPEITPPEMSKWLGLDKNFGMLGGNGMPPNFGEMIPPRTDVLFEHLEQQIKGRGVGLSSIFTPSRGLFLDMDKQSKGATDLFRHFENLQSGYTARNNFITTWFEGKAPGITPGVKPLKDIMKIAGKDHDEERLTAWLEAAKGTPEAAAIEAEMTPGELKAAPELRKWYNELFKSFGVEADYIENYAPHWRMTNGKFGNQPVQIWSAEGNDPRLLPNGAKFFADHYRDGTLDIYDNNAFRMAARYLKAGANQRFTSEAWQGAKDYAVLLNSSDETRAFVGPFKNFLLALKGAEFSYQPRMIGETLQTVLESLPGSGTVDPRSVDKLTNYLLGIMYSSVMGARPALALRNALQPLLMTWPIIGGGKNGFMEAVGRALTQEGKNAAIIDRAIDVKGTSFAHFDEIQSVLPKVFEDANNAGMYLYDRADQFTRAVSYWAGRLRAEKALVDFAEAAKQPGLDEAGARTLRRKLIKESGMHIQDGQIQAEFLRRATIDPTGAAGFAGKQLSDVTNFLYGRGMQARWMRSIPGRFLGQFGSWSMWYVDYLRRITTNMVRNGYRLEAANFLGRHALVNGAILYAGYDKLHIDLSRWVAYNSMFYSGGPALQIAAGASTLMRGVGSVASGAEDPMAQSRITEGSQMIKQTLPNFVPFYFAGRDMIRLSKAGDPTELLAAALSTRPTGAYEQDKAIGIILGEDNHFTSSSPALEDQLNELARGNPNHQVLTLDEVQALIKANAMQAPTGLPGANAPASQGIAPAQGGAQPSIAPVQPPQPVQPSRLPGEVVKPAESKPIGQY